MRAVRAVPIAMAILAHASTSSAQSPTPTSPLAITWDAPAECPTRAQIIDQIHQRLGGRPSNERAPMLAAARVERRDDGRYHVHISTITGGISGERDLEDASCDALARAAALVLALTFDPDAVAKATPPGPSTTAPPPRADPRPTAVAQPSPSPSTRRYNIDVHAEAQVALGVLPGAAFALEGGVTLLLDSLALTLAGSWYPTRSAVVEGTGRGGDFRMLSGTGSVCYVVVRSAFEAAPCLGLEIGRILAEGTGVSRPDASSGEWLAPFAAARAFIPIVSVVGIRFDMALGAPILRNRFVLVGHDETVHRASAVFGRFALGPEMRF